MNAPLLAVAVAVAVAVAAAGASAAGQVALGVAVLTCQGLLVAGWYAAGPLSLGRAGAAVAFGAGAAADVLMLFPYAGSSMSPVLAVVAAVVGAALIVHLRAVRDGVIASLAGTVTVSVLVVLLSALVAQRGGTQGQAITMAVIVAAALGTAVLTLRAPTVAVSHDRDGDARTKRAATGGALGAAGGAGLLAGLLAPELGIRNGVSICLVAGLFVLVAHEIVTFATRIQTAPQREPAAAAVTGTVRRGGRAAQRAAAKATRRQSQAALLLGATLPLALAAPASYILGRLLVG